MPNLGSETFDQLATTYYQPRTDYKCPSNQIQRPCVMAPSFSTGMNKKKKCLHLHFEQKSLVKYGQLPETER